jgi:hypothetical protein
MIEQLLGIDINNIQPHHSKVIQELINYNTDLQYRLQIYTEYEDIDGITKEEFILNEQDTLYTILGTTAALLFVYNRIEQFELSADLHKEMKTSFCLIMNEIFPSTNNEQKFHDLVEKMFDGFKQILQ